ncbi:hypothetical protein BDW22DRAFT_136997 [Trametopsis cervina]|nr:hypothetical protein BDW22DRAFT_136997 [Trametopsis cervina]
MNTVSTRMSFLPAPLAFFALTWLNELVAAQYAAIPRWGQAVSVVQDVLYIHGGRTDPYNSYSYSSAPISNDLLALPLNASFNPATPDFQYLSGCSSCSSSQGPAVSWHTLTPFNTTGLLLFGGATGPNSPGILPDGSDSSVLLSVANQSGPIWDFETESWADEPMRRIHHTAVNANGKIWIVGGEKADGSGSAFSQHYSFEPLGPSFTQLPSPSGPADITGHQSVVLSNGRVLVFGGYSPSQNSLLPFTTIWSLDTTSSNTSWSTLAVSTNSVPLPRRAFAATVIESDKVLIHGGADAELQNNLADGWILDTTQNPMTWVNVSELAQLGPRRDHFATGVGGTVIFGFGYAPNGPASASLDIFDTVSRTFLTTYTPPATSPPSTTGSPGQSTGTSTSSPPLGSGEYPFPTDPPKSGGGGGGGNGNGNGGGGNGNGDDPSNPSGASDTSKHGTVIALSTVFGVLGLVVATTAATWYLRRQRSRTSFHQLDGSGDEESPISGGPVLIAGAHEKGGTAPIVRNVRDRLSKIVPGITPTQVQGRRDMLADEDTREFGSWIGVSRDPSSGQSSRTSTHRPTLDRLYDSLASLRSAGGAMLGYATSAAGGRGLKSRESSTSTRAGAWQSREKKGSYDPYSDNVGLIYDAPSLAASHPRGGRQQSSYTYLDPFEDYDIESLKFDPQAAYRDESDEEDVVKGYPILHDPPPRTKLQSPATLDLTRLTPGSEHSLIQSLSVPSSGSETSLSVTAPHSPFQTSSNGSHDPQSPASGRRPSSIIDANPSISQNMRRSNTWWGRFSKTPLLERARSNSSTASTRPIDFRDPNPPPRLVTIEESMHSNSPDSPTSKKRTNSSGNNQMYAHHRRSQSSLQTAKTADSETLDRLANTMQIVQKGSSSSKGPSRSTSGGDEDQLLNRTPSPPLHTQPTTGRPLSIISSNQSQGLDDTQFVQSPGEMTHEESWKPLGDLASPPARPLPARQSSSSKVAEQIAAYERRMSQHEDPAALRRTRHSAYGLAPKPSLFVANPDHTHGSSSDS